METACKVYTKLMLQRGHGYPLWEPEPNEAGEVLIGDVGYILDGGFYRLFNATLAADHPVNARYGVPDGYQPFTYPEALLHRRSRVLEPKPLCSKNVVAFSVEASADLGFTNPGVSGGVRFKCSDEQAAVLVLKRPGNREVLHPCRDLSQYILTNHQSWYTFARDVFRLDIGEDDIIFVSGSIKTAEWALAAATHRAREGELSFGGEFGPLAKATFSVSATREMSMSVEHRTGPHSSASVAENEGHAFDQCVFLHYYKLKRRKILPPKVIRAAGERHSSPSCSPRRSPDSKTHVVEQSRSKSPSRPSEKVQPADPEEQQQRRTSTSSNALKSSPILDANSASPAISSSESGAIGDESPVIERIPSSDNPRDPLNTLLDYILASAKRNTYYLCTCM
ncbi:hypothetical protein GY45DRAFT_1294881 [Cubamyces sp. BRFM 1775]|nr:hypothetical protein GY45DRAFT_1294881 [Cubamyces sp. BRFM 1775]